MGIQEAQADGHFTKDAKAFGHIPPAETEADF
jgi:hypothetical protein